MTKKKEPTLFPAEKPVLKDLKFGEWAICPKCRARPREVVCPRCEGKGIVPNVGPVPFVKPVGK